MHASSSTLGVNSTGGCRLGLARLGLRQEPGVVGYCGRGGMPTRRSPPRDSNMVWLGVGVGVGFGFGFGFGLGTRMGLGWGWSWRASLTCVF